MKRIATLIAAAALLSACGGSDQAESPAAASNAAAAIASAADTSAASAKAANGKAVSASAAGSISSSPHRVAAPQSIVVNRIDPRLRGRSGQVEVWVSLAQNSVAAERAALAESSGLATAQGGELAKSMRAVRQAASDHRQRIAESQATLASNIAAVGGRELARVQVAHNAIAVRIDASQLTQLAALSGVARIRPVLNYEMTLSETVPYVGGTAVQASGRDGTGVTVAVLDSGIDYTHRNLGGPGTTAAYAAAYGADPADPKNTTLDGLFPTAKVIGGFDFVGEVLAERPDLGGLPHRGSPTRSTSTVTARTWPTSSLARAWTARIRAWPRVPSSWRSRCAAQCATSCNGIALLQGMDFALDPNGDGDTADAVDIINMSLGSDYGQIEDDLTEASTNAVKLGVIVVTAAGNGANKPYIVGSPSIAPGVISVAQTAGAEREGDSAVGKRACGDCRRLWQYSNGRLGPGGSGYHR